MQCEQSFLWLHQSPWLPIFVVASRMLTSVPAAKVMLSDVAVYADSCNRILRKARQPTPQHGAAHTPSGTHTPLCCGCLLRRADRHDCSKLRLLGGHPGVFNCKTTY